jgi:hypothetical protein
VFKAGLPSKQYLYQECLIAMNNIFPEVLEGGIEGEIRTLNLMFIGNVPVRTRTCLVIWKKINLQKLKRHEKETEGPMKKLN